MYDFSRKNKMTHVNNDSIQCVQELEQIGLKIEGKSQLIERLTEINHWQTGFACLVKNGERIHIKIKAEPTFIEKVKSVLLKYGFGDSFAQQCSQTICTPSLH